MDLSILIPARNEEFLARTIQDILENIELDTEVIAVLDGALADPPLPIDARVKVIYYRDSIGQRAATNAAAKIAKGKYLMKVDAHCAFDKGFDRKLIAKMQDDYTMVPIMKNLHAFDWVCEDGHRRYQGPSGPCHKCKKPTQKDILWKPKQSPKSTSYCFDSEPHFQYFNDYCKRKEYKKMLETGLTDTMSLQGSCFLLTKKKYFELNICDHETFGSWGSQGIEVACKTWLSGGRVVCNHDTWYAHMFRTQGGDFSFPYHQSGKQVNNAKRMAKEIFFNDKWPLQKRKLNTLIEQFWPIIAKNGKGWTEEELRSIGGTVPEKKRKPSKGVVYYTHGVGDLEILEACRKQIKKGIKEKHIVSVSTEILPFGHNIVKQRTEGWIDLFERIIKGLEASTADVIFLCEHDVMYHPSHFDFVPPENDAYYYNTNVWKVRLEDGFALKVDDCKQLSGLCAYRETLLQHFQERIHRIKDEGFTRGNGFEPGTRSTQRGGYDDLPAYAYTSKYPNIDIRHDKNATQNRWSKDEFRNQKFTEGWTESHISRIEGWEYSTLPDILKV